MGQFLLGLVLFVLGTSYLLAPLFSRDATWQTGGACSPTLFALGMAVVGIWQMIEPIAGDVEAVRTWTFIIAMIIALLIGEGWRRRIVRPEDIMRRLRGGPSRDDVARGRFEEKKRKEKEEAERIIRDEEASAEHAQETLSNGRRLPRDTQARWVTR